MIKICISIRRTRTIAFSGLIQINIPVIAVLLQQYHNVTVFIMTHITSMYSKLLRKYEEQYFEKALT